MEIENYRLFEGLIQNITSEQITEVLPKPQKIAYYLIIIISEIHA